MELHSGRDLFPLPVSQIRSHFTAQRVAVASLSTPSHCLLFQSYLKGIDCLRPLLWRTVWDSIWFFSNLCISRMVVSPGMEFKAGKGWMQSMKEKIVDFILSSTQNLWSSLPYRLKARYTQSPIYLQFLFPPYCYVFALLQLHRTTFCSTDNCSLPLYLTLQLLFWALNPPAAFQVPSLKYHPLHDACLTLIKLDLASVISQICTPGVIPVLTVLKLLICINRIWRP